LAIGIWISDLAISPAGKSSKLNVAVAYPVASLGARTEHVKAVPQQNPSNAIVFDSSEELLNLISTFGCNDLSNEYLVRSPAIDE